MLKFELGQMARFVVAGFFNTALGYVLFLGFFFLTNLSAPVSNTLSYLIVVLIAFSLYKRFVFDASQPQTVSEVVAYFVSAAVAFSLNLLVLITLLNLGFSIPLAQISAMAVYTVCFYLLNRFVVFRS